MRIRMRTFFSYICALIPIWYKSKRAVHCIRDVVLNIMGISTDKGIGNGKRKQ